jgi:hypothetical protein
MRACLYRSKARRSDGSVRAQSRLRRCAATSARRRAGQLRQSAERWLWLRQSVPDPAKRAAEDAATVPSAVDNCLAEVAELVARDDQRPGLGPVIDLPGLLGRPPRAGSAQRDLWMIAQMHHEGRVVCVTTTPALRRWSEFVLDSSARRGHDPSLCLGGHRLSAYEQNTQQSPGFGFSVAPQPWQT